MKKISFLACLLLFTYVARSSDLDLVFTLKGFFIIRYNKAEIKFMYDQKVQKQRGQSFTTLTDLEYVAYFIPSKIGAKNFINLSTLINQIKNYNSFNRDTIFYMPISEKISDYIYKIEKTKVDLSKEICIFRDIDSSSPYLAIKGVDKYLYKCIYIDGKATVFSVNNTAINRIKLDLDIDAVNRKASKFSVLFLTSINSYDPYVIHHKGVTPWYPYISN